MSVAKPLRNTDHRDFTDERVEHPATWFVPGGPSGPSTVEQRKGYVVRSRGDTAALRQRLGVEPRRIPREFVCPVHGRFTREVDETVDEVSCDADEDFDFTGMSAAEACEVSNQLNTCGLTSPWSPSSVGQGKSSGEVMS